MNNIEKLTIDIYKTFSNNNHIQVILFTAKWCDSCKMVYPVIEELGKLGLNNVNIYIVDVDEEQELLDEFQVFSIPTIVITKNNKVYRKELGYRSLDILLSYIELIQD